jgi:hypothetical protein
MRLATAVGQTHGCYFWLNKLSSLCTFGFSTCVFSSVNSFLLFISVTKIEIISEKKVRIQYLLHIFASKMNIYSK